MYNLNKSWHDRSKKASLRCMNLKINGFLYVEEEYMPRLRVAIVQVFRILCNALDGSRHDSCPLFPDLYPLLSQHSIRLFVNELVIRERKDWFIPDRCVLSRSRIKEWGYCSASINLFYIPFLFSFSLFALPSSVFLSGHPLFEPFWPVAASRNDFHCKIHVSFSHCPLSWPQQGEAGIENKQSGCRIYQCQLY